MTAGEAGRLLLAGAGDLLTGVLAPRAVAGHTPLGDAMAQAQRICGPAHPAAVQAGRALAHVTAHPRHGMAAMRPPAPAVAAGAPLRVCLVGRHADRTPLAREPIRRSAGTRVETVADPMTADIVMAGSARVFEEERDAIAALARARPGLRVVVVPETPEDGVPDAGVADCAGTPVRYGVLDHRTSAVFDVETLPYAMLIDPRMPARHAMMLARFAACPPDALLARWGAAAVPVAFHPVAAPAATDPFGAEIARRLGIAAPDGGPRRGDRHLDWLATQDGRVRIVAIGAAGCRPDRVLEALFDAVAVGGIPAACTALDRQVLDSLPGAAIRDAGGRDAAGTARTLAEIAPDRALAERWLETAARLHRRVTDLGAMDRERRRVVDALLNALEEIVP